MAAGATEKKDFLEPDYYPRVLPGSIQTDLALGVRSLDKRHLFALAADWHLNTTCFVVSEALHLYSAQQRYFLSGVVATIIEERNYFAGLREFLMNFIKGFSDSLKVDISGQRLTYSNLMGSAYLDTQYARDALAWYRRGDTPVFVSYQSFSRLPRVLDAYRNSERPILIHVKVSEQGERCYHIVPATQTLDIFNEEEFLAKGGDLIAKGIRRIMPVSEQ